LSRRPGIVACEEVHGFGRRREISWEIVMVWMGTLLAVVLAVGGYGAWWLLKARQMPLGNWIGAVALAIWLTGVSIVWLVEDKEPSRPTGRTQSGASLAWPGTTGSAIPTVGARDAGVQAAPVESLVSGLEARLKEQPNDPEGWTLLAQSYAYTSNEEAVERAVRRAVELGVDEQMLRDRVASAGRRAQPVDWAEQGIRASELR
jgi:hypothetical protein